MYINICLISASASSQTATLDGKHRESQNSGDPQRLVQANSIAPYVGTERCIECHKEEYQSYLRTTHSQTVSSAKADNENEFGSFNNSYSGFKYSAYAQGNDLIHEQKRVTFEGESIGSDAKQIDFTIGSGTHGKSYVFEDQLFWYQSPISWFESEDAWGMSPGYRGPYHSGFNRKLSDRCFFCHVGKIEHKNQNPVTGLRWLS